MKLNNSTQKTKSLLKLFSVLCLVAFTFCTNTEKFQRISSKKLSTSTSRSKSKELPDVFDSTLTLVTNEGKKSTSQEYKVKLTKDFLSKPLSGFKFEMQISSDKINSGAVSATKGGYFVKYQLFTNGINCEDSGWFSKNSMTYFLSDGKVSYSLTFTFPKSYLLWDSVKNDDLKNLCFKIFNNYNNYKSELNKKTNEVISALSAAKNLEDDKAKNMQTRQDFELAAKGKGDAKKLLIDQLSALNTKKQEYIDEIKKIEESKTTTQKNFDNLVVDIQKQEQIITNINKIIEEKSKSSAEIKLVTDKDIDERYDAVKLALGEYSKLYLARDPFVVNTISPLLANVKVNKDRIIPALRMN